MTHFVNLTFDVDLHLLWTGTHKRTQIGEMSRGEFGLLKGLPRILALLEEEEVQATFFIPGKIAEIFPESVALIHAKGHEIGVHGYAHERWNELDEATEYELVSKSKKLLENITNEEIIGFRSPAWSLNTHSVGVLQQLKFAYDSSLMADDYQSYTLREGDYMTLDGEFVRGVDSALIEFPVAWELDDFPYFCFNGKQVGLRLPGEVLTYWKEEFDASRTYGNQFILTMHPQIIGRAPRIEMLRQLIRYMKSYNDSTFSTLKQTIQTGVI